MIYRKGKVLAKFYAFWGHSRAWHTYTRISRPSVSGLKLDPAVDIRNGQELGNLAVCDHFMLWFVKNAHGNRVSDEASDSIFVKARLFGNLVEGDLASCRNHIRDFVSAHSIDGD
jgi:hypothetical protein